MGGIELTIHGQVVSKKNSKRIVTNHQTGNPMIVSSKRHKSYHGYAMTELHEFKLKNRALSLPISYPVRIRLRLINVDNRKRDIDNMATTILDLLVDAGILAKDDISIVQELNIFLWDTDKNDPRCEIKIEEINR